MLQDLISEARELEGDRMIGESAKARLRIARWHAESAAVALASYRERIAAVLQDLDTAAGLPIGTAASLAHKFRDPHYGRASGCCAIANHGNAWRDLSAAVEAAKVEQVEFLAIVRRAG